MAKKNDSLFSLWVHRFEQHCKLTGCKLTCLDGPALRAAHVQVHAVHTPVQAAAGASSWQAPAPALAAFPSHAAPGRGRSPTHLAIMRVAVASVCASLAPNWAMSGRSAVAGDGQGDLSRNEQKRGML